MLKKAFDALSGYFDPVHGGFGPAPKFPQPTMLTLLLNYWRQDRPAGGFRHGGEDAWTRWRAAGSTTISGGGFHRYSTDAQWLVPHFEKMLYDQAMLSRAYVQAYQVGGKPTHAMLAQGHVRVRPAGHDGCRGRLLRG